MRRRGRGGNSAQRPVFDRSPRLCPLGADPSTTTEDRPVHGNRDPGCLLSSVIVWLGGRCGQAARPPRPAKLPSQPETLDQRALPACHNFGRAKGWGLGEALGRGWLISLDVEEEVLWSESAQESRRVEDFAFCHCSKCRRWDGHVGADTAVDRPGFQLIEQRGLRRYVASLTVQRGFCGECGSSLFWDEDGVPKMSICAGTLDGPTGLTPKAHIYLGSKGDYYEVPDDCLLRREEFTH